jgi:hypothetical protein
MVTRKNDADAERQRTQGSALHQRAVETAHGEDGGGGDPDQQAPVLEQRRQSAAEGHRDPGEHDTGAAAP